MVYALWGLGVMYVYIVGCGVLQIPDIFRTADFVLICDLVVCVYRPLPILLCYVEVLFGGFLGLKLLFTAMCLKLLDYSVVRYGSVTKGKVVPMLN
jgi:hypothetical protein